MRIIEIKQAKLADCIKRARDDRVVITRNGKPLVLMVNVAGMDLEQVELGSSDKFWTLMTERRKEKTISRQELERRLNGAPAPSKRQRKRVTT